MSHYDIPEPSWWAKARRLEKLGVTRRAIAERFDKAPSTVYYVLSNYKDTHVRSSEASSPRKSKTGHYQDGSRAYRRKLARELWREQGKTKSLDSYYRQLECL